MIKRYNEFVFENLNKSKAILKSKLDDYEKLKKFLTDENAMGYMGKFTELLFSNVPYNELITLYNNVIDLKRKNIRINVDDFDKYEKILDEIAKLQTDYKFKNIFNQFPKEQKDIFTKDQDTYSNWMGKDWKQTMSKLYDVDYKPFISKISRYKDVDDLMDAIERFLNSKLKSFERDAVKALLNNDLKLVFENENILIVRTYTHDAISLIGSDTSWCIVSSEHTFKNYISKGSAQFVLFDYTKDRFDPDFKIGFTLDKNNLISYAHDVFDKSIIPYTSELLSNNGVKMDMINAIPKPDITKLSTQNTSYEIDAFIRDNNIPKYDDIFRSVLSLVSKKISESPLTIKQVNGRRSKSYERYNLIETIRKMFFNLKEYIQRPLEISEFESYKNELGEHYDEVKKLLSEDYRIILLSDVKPKSIFSLMEDHPEILIKNYKRWDYEINRPPDYFIDRINENPELAEVILYYCNKGRIDNTKKLIVSYCKIILGETVNMNDVKNIINRSFSTSKYDYFNEFGIKYHFDITKLYKMNIENVIDEDIHLKNVTKYEFKNLQERSITYDIKSSINITYDKSYFNSILNDSCRWLGGKAVKRANVDNNIMTIIYPLVDKIISKNRKLEFSNETKFPIEYTVSLQQKDKTKEIKIIIK